jgi:hypothetical protein
VPEAVAIVSVLSTAIVAVAVPFINAKLETKRFRLQVAANRADELRDVLEDVASRAISCHQTLISIRTAVEREPPKAKERLEAGRQAYIDLWESEARVGVRLGTESPVYRTYSELVSALQVLAFASMPDEADQPGSDDRSQAASVRAGKAMKAFLHAAAARVNELPA